MRTLLVALILLQSPLAGAQDPAPETPQSEATPTSQPARQDKVTVHEGVVTASFFASSNRAAMERACESLAPEAVRLTIDGHQPRITSLEYQNQPIVLQILVDVSGSMESDHLDRAEESIARLASRLAVEDRVVLASMGLDHRLISAMVRPNDSPKWPKVTRIPTSVIWPSVQQGLRYMEGFDAHTAILLITDGIDSSHKGSFEELVDFIGAYPKPCAADHRVRAALARSVFGLYAGTGRSGPFPSAAPGQADGGWVLRRPVGAEPLTRSHRPAHPEPRGDHVRL